MQFIGRQLIGRKLLMLIDYEAARAALTKGEARSDLALHLIYSLWTTAAKYNMISQLGMVPSDRNATDGQSGEGRDHSFSAKWGKPRS